MLVINTAFKTANIGLKTADGRVFERQLDSSAKHSENVLKTIDEICEEAEVDVLSVDTVAVVTGPGSFTGLRIAVSIAKALGCVNKNLKFLSLSSLQLMAYISCKNHKHESDFVCALDALSKLYFVAEFDNNGNLLKEEKIVGENEFLSLNLPIIGLKGDLDVWQQVEISTQDVLEFALIKEKEKNFVSADQLMPVYLRLSQAEDNLLTKKSEKVD